MADRRFESAKKFGRLKPIALVRSGSQGGQRIWICRCECGSAIEVRERSLASGNTRSCGCLKRDRLPALWAGNVKHGHWRGGKPTKEHKAWQTMISRCCNPSDASFSNYGGRGIIVCERWVNSFEAFLCDIGLAPSTAHSLGRLDNMMGYEPGNVTWQTSREQCNNMRTNRIVEFRGQKATLMDWSRRMGFRYGTIQQRLDAGWSVERAFTEPSRQKR